jgi:hypothetical protein
MSCLDEAGRDPGLEDLLISSNKKGIGIFPAPFLQDILNWIKRV